MKGEDPSGGARKWVSVCDLHDILPNAGACVLIEGRQIAVFRIGECVFALDNLDPASGANVLSRGLVGSMRSERVVASPMYKHHFSLTSGQCLEDASLSVNVYPTQLIDGRVWIQPEPQPGRRGGRRRLVVVGNGMAAMRTVEDLLELDPHGYEITVFGAESHGSYNRILLSPLLAGEKEVEEIITHPRSWYAERQVTLHAGDPVVQIDRRRRLVYSKSGVECAYERLLLATGSKPFVLPIPGAELPGVVTFRDLADVDTMLSAARDHPRAAIVGGGLLGLEAASALARRGMEVTVVHLVDTLMERQLDRTAAGLLRSSLEQRGIRFRMPAKTTAVQGKSRVERLCFADGTELETDLIVMAIGVRPNIDLAAAAGLQCERGVLVDDTLQTYDPSIYAVGECVQHRKNTFGLVAPLWEQARVCAAHLAEVGAPRYRGTVTGTQLKVTGIDLYSAGDFAGAETDEALVLSDPRRGIYKRVVIRDNRLRGAVLYGEVADGPRYLDLMLTERDISTIRDQLLFGVDDPVPPPAITLTAAQ